MVSPEQILIYFLTPLLFNCLVQLLLFNNIVVNAAIADKVWDRGSDHCLVQVWNLICIVLFLWNSAALGVDESLVFEEICWLGKSFLRWLFWVGWSLKNRRLGSFYYTWRVICLVFYFSLQQFLAWLRLLSLQILIKSLHLRLNSVSSFKKLIRRLRPIQLFRRTVFLLHFPLFAFRLKQLRLQIKFSPFQTLHIINFFLWRISELQMRYVLYIGRVRSRDPHFGHALRASNGRMTSV